MLPFCNIEDIQFEKYEYPSSMFFSTSLSIVLTLLWLKNPFLNNLLHASKYLSVSKTLVVSSDGGS